jgi:hypothetical protein
MWIAEGAQTSAPWKTSARLEKGAIVVQLRGRSSLKSTTTDGTVRCTRDDLGIEGRLRVSRGQESEEVSHISGMCAAAGRATSHRGR